MKYVKGQSGTRILAGEGRGIGEREHPRTAWTFCPATSLREGRSLGGTRWKSGGGPFLLPTSPGQDSLNPKGIPSISPGLRAARYPGFGGGDEHNPERVASPAVSVARKGCNPVGVEDLVSAHSQGSSPTRNPGLNDAIPLGLAEKQPGLVGNRKSPLALLASRSPATNRLLVTGRKARTKSWGFSPPAAGGEGVHHAWFRGSARMRPPRAFSGRIA